MKGSGKNEAADFTLVGPWLQFPYRGPTLDHGEHQCQGVHAVLSTRYCPRGTVHAVLIPFSALAEKPKVSLIDILGNSIRLFEGSIASPKSG
jgi:hypothetical protein